MNETKIISFPSAPVVKKIANVVETTRARAFDIRLPDSYDRGQYARAIRACIDAKLSLKCIANAGDYLGHTVIRSEVDASLLEGWQVKSEDFKEDELQIRAWQNRGETVSNVNQIASPTLSGREMVVVSQDLATVSTPNTIKVVEGINVAVPENPGLENNPYLKSISDFDKAA